MTELTAIQILDMLGRDAIAESVGVGKPAVNKAAQRNIIPALWYARVRAMCEKVGVTCPLSAFSWKNPPPFSGDQILEASAYD